MSMDSSKPLFVRRFIEVVERLFQEVEQLDLQRRFPSNSVHCSTFSGRDQAISSIHSADNSCPLIVRQRFDERILEELGLSRFAVL